MTNVNHPEQFKLFMTGTEWQEHVTHSIDGPLPSLWKEKEARARMPEQKGVSRDPGPNQISGGIYDRMRKSGYQASLSEGDDPPTIILEKSPNGKSIRRVQAEGHHRVAAAAAIERDTGKPIYIPTNYVDNTKRGRGGSDAW